MTVFFPLFKSGRLHFAWAFTSPQQAMSTLQFATVVALPFSICRGSRLHGGPLLACRQSGASHTMHRNCYLLTAHPLLHCAALKAVTTFA